MRRLARQPDRIEQLIVLVGIAVRPAIHGNARDVAGGVEAARPKRALELVADVALEGLERGRQQFGIAGITQEHVQNNSSVRNILVERGIKPENLPASEDIQKLERKAKSSEKKLIKENALPKLKGGKHD